jgi:hypothetical protein
MPKLASIAFAVLVISVIDSSFAMSAQGANLDDLYAKCRQEVLKIYPANDTNLYLDRPREYAFNACVTNGGTMPR